MLDRSRPAQRLHGLRRQYRLGVRQVHALTADIHRDAVRGRRTAPPDDTAFGEAQSRQQAPLRRRRCSSASGGELLGLQAGGFSSVVSRLPGRSGRRYRLRDGRGSVGISRCFNGRVAVADRADQPAVGHVQRHLVAQRTQGVGLPAEHRCLCRTAGNGVCRLVRLVTRIQQRVAVGVRQTGHAARHANPVVEPVVK